MKRFSLDRRAAAMFPHVTGAWVKFEDAMDAIAEARCAAPYFVDPDVAAALDDLQVKALEAVLGDGVDIDRVHLRFAAVEA